ncbi:hypothetical protein [Stenomitos frigidus]|uniref:DNA recombination and repair protein Rad51-like C-terminal domain-containing protein n=1 Tax=Stenomitos frigidus ULC18 TaxID=2107698 RepID=A0A2T1EE34_9CYAN|nr:hypothetical protein [Stenomitos frigidus]PSB31009.1 hypothetical protein C7B82_07775 [Stenomitos frigidus ULC18]
MTAIASLLLRDARPDNQAHLLLWDTPNPFELDQITRYNNAQRVNYRENLLQRTDPTAKFLTLHHQVDEEMAAIKAICDQAVKPVVLLEGLDCLITYLNVQPGDYITLFWSSLESTRKLSALLWIILPHKLAPKTWSESRLVRIPHNTL